MPPWKTEENTGMTNTITQIYIFPFANNLLSPLIESTPKEYLSIRSATKQPPLRGNGTESAQLPGNHFCQKWFSSDPADGQLLSFLGKTLLRGTFLFLRPGHPGNLQSGRNKVPILKAAAAVPPAQTAPHREGARNHEATPFLTGSEPCSWTH